MTNETVKVTTRVSHWDPTAYKHRVPGEEFETEKERALRLQAAGVVTVAGHELDKDAQAKADNIAAQAPIPATPGGLAARSNLAVPTANNEGVKTSDPDASHNASVSTENLDDVEVADLKTTAKTLGIYDQIEGSGAGGRVVKQDLVDAIAKHRGGAGANTTPLAGTAADTSDTALRPAADTTLPSADSARIVSSVADESVVGQGPSDGTTTSQATRVPAGPAGAAENAAAERAAGRSGSGSSRK